MKKFFPKLILVLVLVASMLNIGCVTKKVVGDCLLGCAKEVFDGRETSVLKSKSLSQEERNKIKQQYEEAKEAYLEAAKKYLSLPEDPTENP